MNNELQILIGLAVLAFAIFAGIGFGAFLENSSVEISYRKTKEEEPTPAEEDHKTHTEI